MVQDEDLKRDVAIYLMNYTDIEPGKALTKDEISENIKNLSNLNVIEWGEITIKDISRDGIITEISDGLYMMDYRYAPYKGCEIGLHDLRDVINYIYPRVDYRYMYKKVLLWKIRKKMPGFKKRLEDIYSDSDCEFERYRELKDTDPDQASRHLRNAFNLSQIVGMHDYIRDNNTLIEILFYHRNGLYLKALESAERLINEDDIPEMIEDKIIEMMHVLFEDCLDRDNYGRTVLLGDIYQKFDTGQMHVEAQSFNSQYAQKTSELIYDIENGRFIYEVEGETIYQDVASHDTTSKIWLGDVPPHRIEETDTGKIIIILDDNGDKTDRMPLDEFRDIWLDDEKRKERMPQPGEEVKHTEIIFD